MCRFFTATAFQGVKRNRPEQRSLHAILSQKSDRVFLSFINSPFYHCKFYFTVYAIHCCSNDQHAVTRSLLDCPRRHCIFFFFFLCFSWFTQDLDYGFLFGTGFIKFISLYIIQYIYLYVFVETIIVALGCVLKFQKSIFSFSSIWQNR